MYTIYTIAQAAIYTTPILQAKLDSSEQGMRNLDEVYCSVKMKHLSQNVCPYIIDYYGLTAVHLPQNL